MKIDTQQIENPAVYDAAYFIAKFEAIPEHLWCAGDYERGFVKCAYGHCDRSIGERDALEAISCNELSRDTVIAVNDGFATAALHYPQPTPKQRILAWLRDAKEAGL